MPGGQTTGGGWQALTFWPLQRTWPAVVDGYSGPDRPVAFASDGRRLVTGRAAEGEERDDELARLQRLLGMVQTGAAEEEEEGVESEAAAE